MIISCSSLSHPKTRAHDMRWPHFDFIRYIIFPDMKVSLQMPRVRTHILLTISCLHLASSHALLARTEKIKRSGSETLFKLALLEFSVDDTAKSDKKRKNEQEQGRQAAERLMSQSADSPVACEASQGEGMLHLNSVERTVESVGILGCVSYWLLSSTRGEGHKRQ